MHVLKTGDVIGCLYVNWKGEKWIRKFVFQDLIFGSNEYHKEPQFLIQGYDLDKNAIRTYAVKDMSNTVVIK